MPRAVAGDEHRIKVVGGLRKLAVAQEGGCPFRQCDRADRGVGLAVVDPLSFGCDLAVDHQPGKPGVVVATLGRCSEFNVRPAQRSSEERRVGKEWVRTCKYRWSPR